MGVVLVANLFHLYCLEYFRYRILGLGLAFATLTLYRIYLDRHATFLFSKRCVTQSNGRKEVVDDTSFSEVGELIILYRLRQLTTGFFRGL